MSTTSVISPRLEKAMIDALNRIDNPSDFPSTEFGLARSKVKPIEHIHTHSLDSEQFTQLYLLIAHALKLSVSSDPKTGAYTVVLPANNFDSNSPKGN